MLHTLTTHQKHRNHFANCTIDFRFVGCNIKDTNTHTKPNINRINPTKYKIQRKQEENQSKMRCD